MNEKIKLPVATQIKPEAIVINEKEKEKEKANSFVTQEFIGHKIPEAERLLSIKVNELESQLSQKEDELVELRLLRQKEMDFECISSLFESFESSVEAGIKGFSLQASDVVIAALVKILGKSLIKPEVSLSAIKEVINISNESEVHRILVSPEDYMLIEKYKVQLGFSEAFLFVSDTRVESGGCILELSSGLVDGRIDVQLKTLHQLLRNSRG
jgi:flagellar biosynthesis/type III secretory pathway protein FliH